MREALPGQATILGAVDAASSASGHELPGAAHELPHSREQHAGVARYHHQVRGTGRVVHEQHLLPCLAAVRGAVHAALGVGRPHVAQCGHEDNVRIGGIDHDLGNLAHVAQSHKLPALARIGRHEDPAAIHHVVPRVRLPGADPHDVGVRGRERHGADRRRRLIFEDGLPRITAIDRLPYAARCGADVVHVAVSRHADDGGQANLRPLPETGQSAVSASLCRDPAPRPGERGRNTRVHCRRWLDGEPGGTSDVLLEAGSWRDTYTRQRALPDLPARPTRVKHVRFSL